MPAPLNDPDRAAVREALAEIRASPPPDRASAGCVVALPGFVILLVFPVAARILGVGQGLATAALVVGIALLVVGLGLWFSAGGQRRRHAVAATEAALRTLEGGDDDREVLLRAATLLLMHAHAPRGKAVAPTFDAAGASERLGERLAMVRAVESFLLGEEAIYPVFSAEPGPEPD